MIVYEFIRGYSMTGYLNVFSYYFGIVKPYIFYGAFVIVAFSVIDGIIKMIISKRLISNFEERYFEISCMNRVTCSKSFKKGNYFRLIKPYSFYSTSGSVTVHGNSYGSRTGYTSSMNVGTFSGTSRKMYKYTKSIIKVDDLVLKFDNVLDALNVLEGLYKVDKSLFDSRFSIEDIVEDTMNSIPKDIISELKQGVLSRNASRSRVAKTLLVLVVYSALMCSFGMVDWAIDNSVNGGLSAVDSLTVLDKFIDKSVIVEDTFDCYGYSYYDVKFEDGSIKTYSTENNSDLNKYLSSFKIGESFKISYLNGNEYISYAFPNNDLKDSSIDEQSKYSLIEYHERVSNVRSYYDSLNSVWQ